MFWRLYLPVLGLLTALTASAAAAAHGHHLADVLIPAWIASSVLAALFCAGLARRSALELAALTRLAEDLAGGRLSQRSGHAGTGEAAALARSLDSMAASIEGLVARAGREQEELKAILAGVGEGVLATDRAQRILLVNAGAGRLLDFPVEGAAGRNLWEVVPHERVLRAASESLASGARETFQLSGVRGKTLEISVAVWPPQGPSQGLVIVAHDVTESIRYQDLRREFVANVSHELRTPLTLVKGFVETLQDGAVQDPVRGPQYLATIARHVEQLTNLVDDLLDLSRLEGRPGLERRVPVDLAEVAQRVVEQMRPAALKKAQALGLEAPPAVSGVSGDPDYLERAVRNLVDNAIKYTPEGGAVRVEVRERPGAIVLEVSDNGIGIPAEDQPRIFERFYRVDKSRSRDMGGTGLGLSIVKHVVQGHGGSVEVESEAGRGSKFRMVLPVVEAAGS